MFLCSPDSLNHSNISHTPELNKKLKSTKMWGGGKVKYKHQQINLTILQMNVLTTAEEVRKKIAKLSNLGK